MYICAVILEKAIRQKSFDDKRIRAAVNIYYTSAGLQTFENAELKPFGISIQQFNLMRILKGQNGKPISITEISARMIDKMSNASRLAEKLRQKELIDRKTCPNDRRRVEILLTEKGLNLINQASAKMHLAINQKLSHLSPKEVEDLNSILDKINQ